MSIQKEFVLRYRVNGHVRFQIPARICHVDVAKAFFPDGKESKFVNAVLDHMAREAKPSAFK